MRTAPRPIFQIKSIKTRRDNNLSCEHPDDTGSEHIPLAGGIAGRVTDARTPDSKTRMMYAELISSILPPRFSIPN